MIPDPDTTEILGSETLLRSHILKSIYIETTKIERFFETPDNPDTAAAVLFLLGLQTPANGGAPLPCLIFTKRSAKVRQPGDLCFPGGGIEPQKDPKWARLLGLPFSPLTRWPYWITWSRRRPFDAREIPTLLAASLREAHEEVGLKPLKVQFLGPLPAQQLVMYQRTIFPMAGWLSKQQHFKPNWEVDKVIPIPIQDFLDPGRYGRYRFTVAESQNNSGKPITSEYPCYVHPDGDNVEVLWGATFRMVANFLKWVFDFKIPQPDTLPVVERILDQRYLGARS